MNAKHRHDPETEPNPEPSPRLIDPFASERDHANQWDISAIWHPQPDSEPESFDWDIALKEITDG